MEVQVSKFISALGAATGGCISVFFGACDPNAGGKICTRGYVNSLTSVNDSSSHVL